MGARSSGQFCQGISEVVCSRNMCFLSVKFEESLGMNGLQPHFDSAVSSGTPVVYENAYV